MFRFGRFLQFGSFGKVAPLSQQFLTSGGLASILWPKKCALFMAPVCRRVCFEPISDLYTKSNAAKSLKEIIAGGEKVLRLHRTADPVCVYTR